jgi:threonine synthase
MSIWEYATRFSRVAANHQISLGEGQTPIVQSRRIGRLAGIGNLFFKLEMVNPTGSYKDRFAAAAISGMVARGQTRCVATSSGNTGASLAAYCAAARVRCQIAIVETAPADKLDQMLAYGAELCRIRGFGTDAAITSDVVETITHLGEQPGATRQISAFCCSPDGMAGVKTISYELAEQLPKAIDHVFCPAGGGGLTLAVARGFAEPGAPSPRIHCVQPEGNATIAGPLRDGADRAQPVTSTTNISGLQVASVFDGDEVIVACRESGGAGHLVTDAEVFDIQQRLAREEGIFCEPAGAVSVAAALNSRRAGSIRPGEVTVCLITGSGFKDHTSVRRMIDEKSCAEIDAGELGGVFS